MRRQSVIFQAPGDVRVRESDLPEPAPAEVLVRTELSAISAGTELLLVRGEFPDDVSLDEKLPSLRGPARYPLKYGYAAVGKVALVGTEVDPGWLNRRVLAFHPHESYFSLDPGHLLPVPASLPLDSAVLLPNMESAVNFVHDARPLLGERVVVLGAGVLGLLTTRLLEAFPLESLVVLDRYPLRRRLALEMGADSVVDPADPQHSRAVREALGGPADLVLELSGNPEALNLALAVSGFTSRVIVGSFYGTRRVPIDLGGAFHRKRIRLISSQVSSLNPSYSGLWDKPRRLREAWRRLIDLEPGQLITHRFPVQEAPRAYELLDQNPEIALQIVLTYTP